MNSRRIFVLSLALIFGAFLSNSAFALHAGSDPIKEIKKLNVTKDAYDSKRAADKAILIKDEKTAKKYFDEDNLKKLMENVDFENQHVLVFAWQGSGQDKLTFEVAESYPEQISFTLTRGRTRDLRQHKRIFVIRSNVKWGTK